MKTMNSSGENFHVIASQLPSHIMRNMDNRDAITSTVP